MGFCRVAFLVIVAAATAFVRTPAPAVADDTSQLAPTTSQMAPTTWYFGEARLTIAGIRSALYELNHPASQEDSSRFAASEDVYSLEDAIREWTRRFPGDPSLPSVISQLYSADRFLDGSARYAAQERARRLLCDTKSTSREIVLDQRKLSCPL